MASQFCGAPVLAVAGSNSLRKGNCKCTTPLPAFSFLSHPRHPPPRPHPRIPCSALGSPRSIAALPGSFQCNPTPSPPPCCQ
eukprot:1321283-Rhodomonas_salina.2